MKEPRENITKETSKLPDWVGAKNIFSWGPLFINSQYSSFPKYPVSPEIIKEIKTLYPQLPLEGIEMENLNTVKQQRFVPTAILFGGLGLIFLTLGIASTVESYNFNLFNVFNIVGILSIGAGIFYWRK